MPGCGEWAWCHAMGTQACYHGRACCCELLSAARSELHVRVGLGRGLGSRLCLAAATGPPQGAGPRQVFPGVLGASMASCCAPSVIRHIQIDSSLLPLPSSPPPLSHPKKVANHS